jgi:aminoglycoside phosphotransferase family enzyme/predicted kinase
MELGRLIEALSSPASYPHAVDSVQLRQTHISVVFLAGEFAYKLKKPVNLGFLDFTTLDKRRHYCDEEVRLNRRLARSVYLGVVPITEDGRIEGTGEAAEWAVKMERLPEGASLLDRLRSGEVDARLLKLVARRVAEFHSEAERGPRVSEFGRFEVVAGNARENFDQASPWIGQTMSRPVFDRLRARTEETLDRLRPLIEARAARGVPCDTHGDLHLDHVYHFPDRPPPDDLIAIDCIEFNERFRFADPVADVAFLAMDLIFRGRRDLADRFAASYFTASGDGEGEPLLPFYVAYRAAVRGKVEGFQLGEPEIPEADRTAARRRARARWLLALGELEEPARRPALVLVGGLPGSGKSTLARGLAERAGFTVIRSDAVRKELAGLGPSSKARAAVDAGIYAPEMTARTYAECLRRAEELVFNGGRVIVDANFGVEERRRLFLDAAARWCVPACLFICSASPVVARERIAARRGDASDADVAVYEKLAARWQEAGPDTRAAMHELSLDATPDDTLAEAVEALRRARLMG